MDYLPIFIQLRGEPVVVAGGGEVALRKVELLLRAGARITVIAPELHEDLRALAEQNAIRFLSLPFQPHHLDGVSLAIAATDSREVNAAVASAARARRVPVNVVDDAELSSFIFPAIIDRSPVMVAVGSSGCSPVLARRVRQQIETLLPARLGALARFVGDRRKNVQKSLAPEQRRSFWERVIGGFVGSRVLAGDERNADRAFESELAAAHNADTAAADGTRLGEVYLIGAGPGDPDLLTLRAVQLLQQADVILYDRLISDAVLDRARRDAQRIFVGKETGGDHQKTQTRIHELLVHYARRGLRVARLKGGDPFIFGRGGEEIEVLAEHGIPYVVVPGITAALGAAASAGIPLTHRRLAQSVTFAAGHALDDESLDWRSLSQPHHTVVFYMGVAQLPRIVAKLLESGASPHLPAALVERGSLAEQRVARGSISTIVDIARDRNIAPPAVLIVGEVASLARDDEELIATADQARQSAAQEPV
ncbi:MAG: uroporphyrinogen-III C-methyltransferase [Steroidobacteraceae bacterium]|nr:uroporphyrinogen-III C-methyltransferase [Steroidobacteraceae bacterium]